MSEMIQENDGPNPFEVLGLPANADESDVRARYLDLVKKHPPERDPETFRQIRAAFEAASDPLVLAKAMLSSTLSSAPNWKEVIDSQAKRPPRMELDFLLSLGNRDGDNVQEKNGKSEEE
ncbi:J domain-containing protein [Roseiconus lacunae]|uniref:J domain-containing protein n=1 Tax=Roseiconus lacunae TaxID=2605694 RepID=UPI001E306FA0|nr:J domain-containing protein [Roseiconus lacunae]MCD0462476.1 J domain-containing protein [Roseiconus lacunae]